MISKRFLPLKKKHKTITRAVIEKALDAFGEENIERLSPRVTPRPWEANPLHDIEDAQASEIMRWVSGAGEMRLRFANTEQGDLK